MAESQDQGLRLLCFDGGGVRGLSSLFIIKQLMEAVNQTNPPKPCNFFHMIGGTSTGGLIAIMLGRLEMSVDECIDAYINMMTKSRIFTKIRWHRVNMKGELQARYDTPALEASIKKIIRENSKEMSEDILMRDDTLRCKVFACATPSIIAEGSRTINFSSYARDLEPNLGLFKIAKVWQVCRATAAAKTYFDSIKFGPHGLQMEFFDGATGANNPIDQLWIEAEQAFGSSFQSRLQCLVSIGTGDRGVTTWGRNAKDAISALQDLATETETTFAAFERNHPGLVVSGKLYRFNVRQGLENVGLEDVKSKDAIGHVTQAYMGTNGMRKTLLAFRATTNETLNACQELVVRHPEPQDEKRYRGSQAFLSLDRGPKFVNHNPVENSYWSRLTLPALLVYDAVWRAMVHHCEDDRIGFQTFRDYFATLNPRPRELTGDLVRNVWQRLPLEDHDPRASRELILAALYMMHMESLVNPSWKPNFQPPNSNQFSTYRNKFLGLYDNWVRCSCGCERLWSFANGIEGLKYDQQKKHGRACLAEVKPNDAKSSGISKIFRVGEERRRKEALHFFDQNRSGWNRHQRPGDRLRIAMVD